MTHSTTNRHRIIITLATAGLLLLALATAVHAQSTGTALQSPEDYYQRGLELERSGDLAGARNAYRQALQGNYYDPRYHLAYGSVIERMDGLESALYQYQLAFKYSIVTASDSYPGIEMLRRNLVRKYIDVGFPIEDPQLSIRVAQAARGLDPDNPQIRVYLANAFFMNGEYERSIHENRQAVALGFEEGLIYANIASALTQLGEFDQARASLERALFYDEYNYSPVLVAIATEPDTFSTWVSFRAALGDDEVRALVDDSPKGLIARAVYQAERNDLDKALEYAEKACRVGDVHSYARIYLGDIRRMRGENAEAVSAYDEALRINPRNNLAVPRLGDVYYAMADYAKSVEHYDRYFGGSSLSRGEDTARAVLRYADALTRVNRTDDALEILALWVETQYGENPTYEHAMMLLKLLMEQEDWDRAAETARFAMERFAAASDPVLIYATILREQGKEREADQAVNDGIVTLQLFIEQNPRIEEGYVSLAKLYDVKNQPGQAAEALKKGGLATGDPDFGNALYGRGQFEAALDVFAKSIEMNPERPEPRLYFVWVAAESGLRLSEAETHMGKAMALLGSDAPSVRRARGMLAYAKRDYQAAINMWSSLLDRSDFFDKAFFRQLMGNCYAELGEWQEALDCYTAAKELDPELEGIGAQIVKAQSRLAGD